jgi:hypothetical protein
MLKKIIATSVLAVSLAGSTGLALAQSNGGDQGGRDPANTVLTPDTATPDTTTTVDPNSTNSTTGTMGTMGTDNSMGNTPDQNCPSGPQGAMPDASGSNPPNVNGNNCGK